MFRKSRDAGAAWERVFFGVAVDGNYYHGYDVDYYVGHREDAVERLLRFPSLADLEVTMKEKQIPLALIASRLEEADEPGYQPPDNFGHGTHFI